MTEISTYSLFQTAPKLLNNLNSSLGFFIQDSLSLFPTATDKVSIFATNKAIDNFFIPKIDSRVFVSNDVESHSSISFENTINSKRLNALEKRFTRQFISYILEDDFEYGMVSNAYILVKEQLKINAAVTKEWINSIYVNNIKNPDILIGILRIIALFEREKFFPIGDTIALAALIHEDEIVNETAIRAFESWGGIKSIEILETISISSIWIQEYLNDVLSDLKLEYAGQKN